MSNLRTFFQDSSGFYGSNAAFIQELYERFLDNPESVDSSWQEKFRELQSSG